jgi:hypothetical protein
MRGVTGLIPMAHTADVQRSVEFYKLLGMQLRGSLKNDAGGLQWAHVSCKQAELMFTRASEPVIASQQAVLFFSMRPISSHSGNICLPTASVSHPSHIPNTCQRAKCVWMTPTLLPAHWPSRLTRRVNLAARADQSAFSTPATIHPLRRSSP